MTKIKKTLLTTLALTAISIPAVIGSSIALTSCSTQPETPAPSPKKGYIKFQSELIVTTKTLLISQPEAYTFNNLLIEKNVTYKRGVDETVIEKLTSLSNDWDLYFNHIATIENGRFNRPTVSIYGWLPFAKWHNDVWKVLESSKQEFPINSKVTQKDNDNPEFER